MPITIESTRFNCNCPSCVYNERLARHMDRIDPYILSDKPLGSDTLRMLVVYTHAVFEDLLRSILKSRFMRDPTWFNDVGLLVSDKRGNGKFTLSDLAALPQEMTIGDVIEKSVKLYLDKVSFTDVGKIKTWIQRSDLDPSEVEKYASEISAGLERRHRIVHTFDFDDGTGRPTPIDFQDAKKYYLASIKSLTHLIGQIGCDPEEQSAHKKVVEQAVPPKSDRAGG